MQRTFVSLLISFYLFLPIARFNAENRFYQKQIDAFLKDYNGARRVSTSLLVDLADEIDIDQWNRLNDEDLKQMPVIDDYSDEKLAHDWLEWYFRVSERFYQISTILSWRYETNITVESQRAKTEQSLRRSPFVHLTVPIAKRFNEHMKNARDPRLRRIFSHLAMGVVVNETDIEKMSKLISQMTAIYSTTKICQQDQCYALSPDLETFMQIEKDYDRLLWAWQGWHDQSGTRIRQKYVEYIDILNANLQANGIENLADLWIADYEMGDAIEFESTIDQLLYDLMPLYRELHGYVRGRLCEIYPNRFDCQGPIPAHLLGNMWAQTWHSRFDDFIPYSQAPLMYLMAEEFFTSIGLDRMTKKFWARSLFEKPTDREVVCHAAATDFDYRDDYRIRICTELNDEYFYTIHHEMGHIEYYMAYAKTQPFVYHDGANSGFHEAIGDTIGIFAISPNHLAHLGFLDQRQITPPFEINFLLRMALQKVAFIPFGYVMDKYRFALFRNEIDRKNELNSAWWALRKHYGGISPPVQRNNAVNFDPGAKFHVPSNVPYFRYFIAHILQFQFYRAMCRLKGHRTDLHLCDIHGDLFVGERFQQMLQMGSSKPWQEVLKLLTNEDRLESDAMLQYFQPLYDWLKIQNRAREYPVGWF